MLSTVEARAVTDREEVLVARTAASDTTASSCVMTLALTSKFSTMASSTSPHGASLLDPWCTGCAQESHRHQRRLHPSLLHQSGEILRRLSMAASKQRHPSRPSTLGCPAAAAIWAMPRPMVPAPMTPMLNEESIVHKGKEHGGEPHHRPKEDCHQVRFIDCLTNALPCPSMLSIVTSA